jgi:hypothetical protein
MIQSCQKRLFCKLCVPTLVGTILTSTAWRRQKKKFLPKEYYKIPLLYAGGFRKRKKTDFILQTYGLTDIQTYRLTDLQTYRLRVGSSTSGFFPEIPSLFQNPFQKPRLSFTNYFPESI